MTDRDVTAPHRRRPVGWRKLVQAVGLVLLAVVCPFAAVFVTPPRRRDEEDRPEITRP